MFDSAFGHRLESVAVLWPRLPDPVGGVFDGSAAILIIMPTAGACTK